VKSEEMLADGSRFTGDESSGAKPSRQPLALARWACARANHARLLCHISAVD
jgi:hypothetical protein